MIYCNAARGGPNDGHSEHAQKVGEVWSYSSGDIIADRQADGRMDELTDRHAHTDMLIT